MRISKLLVTCSIAVGCSLAGQAHADQRRDWMVAAQPGGTRLNLDVVFPGVQLQLQHRIPIYGGTNELDLKINALPTLVLYESQADVDLRLVILTLGASVGVRHVFHSLEFDPGERVDRVARRDKEFGGDYASSGSAFGEGRATFSLPFNDNCVLLSINAVRFEGGADNVFDWRLGIMRDAGTIIRSDTTLFLKQRSFGAVGPRVQILNYQLSGVRNTQVNYGLTFTTRPGLRARNDIFFLSVLVGVGGTVNGEPTANIYGNHLFKAPITFELAYRTVLELSEPHKPGEDESDED